MVFQISPSVSVTETDLTNIVPALGTSNGATAGQFAWGPVGEIVTVGNEVDLVNTFGKPTNTIYKDFMVASSFLAYTNNLKIVRSIASTGVLNASCTATAAGTGQLIKNLEEYKGTTFTSSVNLFVAKYPGALGNTLKVAWANTATFNDVDSNGDYTWTYRGIFDYAPEANEFHIVVIDEDGTVTGTAGSVLERFASCSTTATKLKYDGTSAYVKNVLQNESKWIWLGKEALLTGGHNGVSLGGGADGAAPADADRQASLALFRNIEEVDVSLIFAAGAGTTASKYIIDSVAEYRKDCVAFVSPTEANVVGITNTATILSNIQSTRTTYGTSSYAVMDSTYKLMLDRYNNVERWVPLNGDIAGLCARTDTEFDPWFSPAGYNRGRIKNAIKFAYNADQTFRDELYKVGVNPAVVFKNEGPVLFGDKTLLTKPSAFDRINVRRLFITVEKAIATASKYYLFEQNDAVTRANFVNTVEPFLRDVQGRRGITAFKVVCDETNNTAEVIDRNELVGSIYIQPTRSINFIKLNFVATRTGVNFDEIIGQ